jgi:hypothetical protein
MTSLWYQDRFAPLKRLLPQAIWRPIRSLATGIITPARFAYLTGHWKSSWAMAACSADGSPTPWYTYPAIDFLSQRSFLNRNVLEIGGGQSTLWWSARAASVLTIEEDAQWCASLRPRIGTNVALHHVPVDYETRSVTPIRKIIDANAKQLFDVIIIDGHLRAEATALAFDYLTSDGAVILDNAEGYGFYDQIKSRGCRRIDFYGFAPGVSLRHCTSVVFVNDCFLLKSDIPIADFEMERSMLSK